jgi:hypothetical protein
MATVSEISSHHVNYLQIAIGKKCSDLSEQSRTGSRRRVSASRVLTEIPSLIHVLVTPIDLFEFRPLFRGKIGRQLPMHFGDRFVHTPCCLSPDRFELAGGLIEDRGRSVHLLRSQVELRMQLTAHPLSENPLTRLAEKKMPRVRRADETAGHRPGHEDEQKADNQLPFE